MEFKGTKGEWIFNNSFVNPSNDNKGSLGSILCNDYYIFQVFDNINMFEKLRKEEAQANAKLIACAPEMLDVLKESFNLMDKLQMPTEFEIAQLRNKLHSLIKKATEL
jgi:hypothetical protein